MLKKASIKELTLIASLITLTACSSGGGGDGSNTNKESKNSAPVANSQNINLDQDTAISITLTGSDADGDELTYTLTKAPSNGSLTSDAPTFTYTPNANYTGEDHFKFIVNDGQVDSQEATISLNIASVNSNARPVANHQNVSTDENTALPITLSGSDADGDSLSYSVSTQPANGSLSGTAPNLTYTPDIDFSGSDSFSFIVNDGTEASEAATVAINVIRDNTAPTAVDQTLSIDEDTAFSITLSGSDSDGDTLTYNITNDPSIGSITGTGNNLTYTPNANANGSDTFSFTVSDGIATSSPADVFITINSVNDAPLANAKSTSTNEDTAIAINLTGSDVDGDTLTFNVRTQPGNGSLSGTAPNLIYTPDANFSGSDSFTFYTSDSEQSSSDATVQIQVNAVNDAPQANGQTLSTDEDTPLPITLSGNDAEGDSLTYNVSTQPTNGSLSGTAPNLTYTPDADFSGSDSFTFIANDGTTDSSPATVNITVNAVNTPPNGHGQNNLSTDNATPLAITLTGSDAEGDALTFIVTQQPEHGALSGTAPNLTYTPDTSFTGTDEFLFKVNDGTTDSLTSYFVRIDVTAATYTIGGTITGLINSGLELENNGGDTLASAGNSFEFATELNSGNGYDVTVSQDPDQQICGVEKGSGTVASSDVNDIEVACRHWKASPSLLYLSGAITRDQEVASDGEGNAMAVWPSNGNILARYYSASNGSWQAARVIDSETTLSYHPQVAFDANGNAIAVWGESNGISNGATINHDIWVNHYSAGSSSWGTAQRIESLGGTGFNPQIAVDNSGNAVVVWQQYGVGGGGGDDIYANTYSAADTAWGNEQILDTSSLSDEDPQIAVDASGVPYVVWQQGGSSGTSIRSAWYFAANGAGEDYRDGSWSTPETISSGTVYSESPQIAFDGNGNGMAVWREHDGTGGDLYDIFAASITVGNPWGTPQLIESDNFGEAQTPQVAMSSTGDAIVVWHHDYGGDIEIKANRYISSSDSWQGLITLEGDNNSYFPEVAMDDKGNAIVVWEQSGTGSASVRSRRYSVVNDAWGTSEELSDGTNSSTSPQVSFGASGHAAVVYKALFNGSSHWIMGNNFD